MKVLRDRHPGWLSKKQDIKNPATLRLKGTHSRIFGTEGMQGFSCELAQEKRDLDLRGRNYDLVTFSNNKLKLTKKDGGVFHFK